MRSPEIVPPRPVTIQTFGDGGTGSENSPLKCNSVKGVGAWAKEIGSDNSRNTPIVRICDIEMGRGDRQGTAISVSVPFMSQLTRRRFKIRLAEVEA